LSKEYVDAFEGTTYQNRIVFVSHPQISSGYLQSLRSFCRKDETHLDQAKMWFRTNGIPVAYGSYYGCVLINGERSKFSYLAQKLDETTWFVFLFGGYGTPDDHFHEAYLVRKNAANERWIEEGVL
jgi:hypothetical protein